MRQQRYGHSAGRSPFEITARVWFFGALLAMTAWLLTSSQSHAADPKHIVILHSFGRDFRPWNEYAKAIRSELDRQSHWVLDIQEHSLMTARLADPQAETAFADYLRKLYVDNTPDLILVIGAPAAIFVQRHRAELFTSVPMIITAVEQRRVQFSSLTDNDTVVAVRHDFRLLFESFLRIAPQTQMIAMINGNSPNELYWQSEMKRELKPLDGRVQIRWFDKLAFPEILDQVGTLPEHAAIFWFQMIVDGAGVAHEGDTPLTQLYARANAPIFTTDEAFFGREIIGGPMHSPIGLAQRVASVVMRILGGEKAGTIKLDASDFGPPKYDWRELQRWKISDSLLPSGARIEFRTPAVWDVYRKQILLICIVVLVQANLIGYLLYVQRQRRFAELQSRQRMSELAHVNRHSVAGELTASITHELNQPLGAIYSNAEAMALVLQSSSPDLDEAREIAADILKDDKRATEIIRRLRSLLKKTPLELDNIDLNVVVSESIDLVSGATAARAVDLRSLPSQQPLPVRCDRIQIQQVVLNLIVNAMDAMSNTPVEQRRVKVASARNGGWAELSISDAGLGIPADKMEEVFQPFFSTKPDGMGMGLSIARTIIEAHNGRITAENQAGAGAIFRVQLPLSASPTR